MARSKRKQTAKPSKASKRVLETAFRCPFCNNLKSCTVKLDHIVSTGKITCSRCPANFSSKISKLSHPIDVYSEWIDACELVNS